MACRYYDDVIVAKLKKWIPDGRNIRILKPDETKRLIETQADDSKDRPLDLPLFALSRNRDIELELNIKNQKSFDSYTLGNLSADLTDIKNQKDLELALKAIPDGTLKINTIPIRVQYQFDIYTKTYDEGDEYVRSFLFKLINNPSIKVGVPYNSEVLRKNGIADDILSLNYIANIRVMTTVSDTSDITEHLFAGQFTRWTIQFEIQDAQLFSVPYRKNWKLYLSADDVEPVDLQSYLEISDHIDLDGELEPIDFALKKQ